MAKEINKKSTKVKAYRAPYTGFDIESQNIENLSRIGKKQTTSLPTSGSISPIPMKPSSFKPHKMYKKGSTKTANTYQEHLNLKEDGYGHTPLTKKGKKDACYHKVKRAVKVWPSAYASGQLVQCRKRGAANWGVGKKKK